MNPSDYRERLRFWLGERVRVVTTAGRLYEGRLKNLAHGLSIETIPGDSTEVVAFEQVAEVWVPLIGA